MKFPKRFSEKPWYSYTVAACAAVLLYVVLTRLSAVWGAVCTFAGYFSSVVLGCVLAYLINPLAMLFQRRLFGGVKRKDLGWTFAVALSVLSVLLLLALLLGTLIPQLVDSGMTFAGNLNGYIQSLQNLVSQWGLAEYVDLQTFLDSSENIMKTLTGLVTNNLSKILDVSAEAGKTALTWGMALILSVYMLLAKERLMNGLRRLFRALLSGRSYRAASTFLRRCDGILIRYIVYSLLDALIVGVTNAVFMTALRMQYAGLVSVVVGVTNLIPTFGPIIGAVIGGFVLLLVRPVDALIFLIFTLVLQFLDGYVIKVKLFGNSLGVSGLLIMIALIVGGNMFGVLGILLSIPFSAILDFIYRDYLLPALEARRRKKPAAPPGGTR